MKYKVFNLTDGVDAYPEPFDTYAQAAQACEDFRARFAAQGFYKAADGLRIPPATVVLHIVEEPETHAFTDEEHAALELLRANGFVVVAFTPEELDGVHPRRFEDRLTEMGNEYIAANGSGEDNESGAFESHEDGY